jgi:hypothetical protein
MAGGKKGGMLTRERRPTRGEWLGGGMVGNTARKMGRSTRTESKAGWSTALAGIAASVAGAVIGMAAARRRQMRRAS